MGDGKREVEERSGKEGGDGHECDAMAGSWHPAPKYSVSGQKLGPVMSTKGLPSTRNPYQHVHFIATLE